jgi:hypothetical protein
MKRTIGLALATATLVVTSACGGSGGRPSVDDVVKSLKGGKAGDLMSLQKDDLTDKAATCFAKAIVGSDLSDKAVRALVDGDESFKGSSADTKAMTSAACSLADCAK